VAGGLCVAVAVVLGLLRAGLIAGEITTVIAFFSLLGNSPLFDCLGQ